VDDATDTTDAISLRGAIDAERTWLDARSWVDLVPGWVKGADALFDLMVDRVEFRPSRLFRYDHWFEEPRLGASFDPSRSPHPVLVDAQRHMQHHYGVRFGGAGLALYRDGSDSIAFHRDRDLRWLDDTVIALLVLGHRRPFMIRPRSNRYDHEAPNRGATVVVEPGEGDLLVMGGACQAGWEHAVPKVPGPVGGRISVQWRWSSHRGRPEVGAGYRAPRLYSR
jgi:hypothetical protein